jgi:hypothetical protein
VAEALLGHSTSPHTDGASSSAPLLIRQARPDYDGDRRLSGAAASPLDAAEDEDEEDVVLL